jgi:hypothetical protein
MGQAFPALCAKVISISLITILSPKLMLHLPCDRTVLGRVGPQVAVQVYGHGQAGVPHQSLHAFGLQSYLDP